MKYGGVCIAVSDINRARKFYEELFGLKVCVDNGINLAFYGGLSIQQDFDWLLDIPKESVAKRSLNMELYFEEENFDEFLVKLEKYPGIRYLDQGVKEQPWGQRSVRFYDLDDHVIEVGEQMKMVVNRFLSSGMTKEETAKRLGVASIDDLEEYLKS